MLAAAAAFAALLSFPAEAATSQRGWSPTQELLACERDLPAATDGTLTLDTPTVGAGTSGLGVLTGFQQWPTGLVGGGSGETFLSCTPWIPSGEAEVMRNEDAALFLFDVPEGTAPGTYPVSVLFFEGSEQPSGDGTLARLSTTVTVTSEPATGIQGGPACQLPGNQAPTGELLGSDVVALDGAVSLAVSGVPATGLGRINEYDQLWFVTCIDGFATPIVHELTPPSAFEVQLPPGLAQGVHTVRVYGLLDSAVVWWERPVTVAAPPPPAVGTVTVAGASCASVTVAGSGWGQTAATVELAVPPSEGGETVADVVAGPVQVFPDTEGGIPTTELRFATPPPDGDYAAVVLVDGLVRAQSSGFSLRGCGAVLPATGPSDLPMVLIGAGLVVSGLTLVRSSRSLRRTQPHRP
jgi:hypothetical protein